MEKQDKIMAFVFRRIDESEMKERELCGSAGISQSSLHLWRDGGYPRIDTLERVLNVLGYELAIKKREAKA